MIKMRGAMIPCHKPAQNPAGTAPFNLYLELGPAILRILGIDFGVMFKY